VGLSPQLIKTASGTRVAYQQLIERIRQLPGVEAADFTNLLPLSGEDNLAPFWLNSPQGLSVQAAPRLNLYWTGVNYLQTMKIPLLRGRSFTERDNTRSPPVIIIDSVLAKTYFPDANPVDQRITILLWGSVQIIGVVGHVRHWSLGEINQLPQSEAYASFSELPDQWVRVFYESLTVIVRTTLDATAVMPAIRKVVYETGPDQPVYDVKTMQEILSGSMSSQRFPMTLLAAFALLALLLASVGIYGVISYSVTERVRETGIRIALGAEKSDIFRMIIGQGIRLALVGIGIGIGAALILTRLLSSFSHLLYGVTASDPATFIGVSLVLTAVSVLACYIPARRATRVDPMVALRYE
jgi:putative ABC transport system permease protein